VDAIYVLAAIAIFALMLALLEGIERI